MNNTTESIFNSELIMIAMVSNYFTKQERRYDVYGEMECKITTDMLSPYDISQEEAKKLAAKCWEKENFNMGGINTSEKDFPFELEAYRCGQDLVIFPTNLEWY